MSQENVELVRRVNDAFAARDIEALLALHHPDAEIIVLRSAIEGPYRGHNGLRRMATEAFNTADLQFRIDEVRDCGNDRVLVFGHQHGIVRGVPFDRVLAEVFEIDAGKVRRSHAFPTVDEALEAAGLRE
jgi:ketosteroid isomerase-like protein